MTVWLLCMLLDRYTMAPVCIREPSEDSCHTALVEWINKAYAWEDRSKSYGHALVTCAPTNDISL